MSQELSQERFITSREGATLLGVERQSFFYYVESRGIRKRETNSGGKDQYEYNYQDLFNIKDDVQAKRAARRPKTNSKVETKIQLSASTNNANTGKNTGTTDWATMEDLAYIYALDCDVYGIEYSVPANKTLPWWQKNKAAIRILFDSENRKDIWGCITWLPMEENTIFDILRGDMSEQEIKAEHILSYEPGKEYSCYVTSCAIRPERRSSFNMLLHSVFDHWCNHPEIYIHKLYGFAVGASGNTSIESDGMRLVKKLFFSPRYDIDENAWELDFNYYNPSPIIQKFQKCLQEKQKGSKHNV